MRIKIKMIFLFTAGCLCFAACNDETAINKVLGISADPPLFTGYKVISGTEVDFNFSKPVTLLSAYFSPTAEITGLAGTYAVPGQSTVPIIFTEDHAGGQKMIADILVQDENGNTLNVLVPFRTRNDRVPEFLINEIRLVAAKPKAEFIEIHTKTAGNLGAMRLYAASTSIDEPIYEFPSVEVAANEYIILHLRTYPDQTNCVDELTGNLGLASITGAPNDTTTGSRDLFIPTNIKYLHNSDVVYLLDQDDKVIDAVVFSDTAASWEKNKNLTKAAEFLAKQEAWLDINGNAVKTPAFSDAANTTGTTNTRTLNRIQNVGDSNTASDWVIVKTSMQTPGLPNKTD